MAGEQGLAEWAGIYRYLTSDTYYIHADGTFEWEGSVFFARSDVGLGIHGAGKAIYDDGKIILRFDTLGGNGASSPNRKYRINQPYTFTAIATGKWHLLLDDETLLRYVNSANRSGRYATEGYDLLHRIDGLDGKRDPATGKALSLFELQAYMPPSESFSHDPAVRRTQMVQLRHYLPPQYASRLLAQPINGKVIQIGPVTEHKVNISEPMHPAEWRMQSSAQITIDLGTQHGVFAGMWLYVGDLHRMVTVEQVEAESCAASIEWIGNGPDIGTQVSSLDRIIPNY